jgi:hypothetical protein
MPVATARVISPATSHQKFAGSGRCIRMRFTPSMMNRPMMPMPTGRNATKMRIVMFQKTTAGPDSHTKCSPGGTFFSAPRRSAHASPGISGWSEGSVTGSVASGAFFLVEDMYPFGDLPKAEMIQRALQTPQSLTKVVPALCVEWRSVS